MSTLDQVHLLEEKVESAVEKLQQLQAENDALRRKCAELTNALSSKTEQLSSFTTDQNEIEDGIKKALDRLNFIENSVLKAGSAKTVNPNGQASIQITPGVSKIDEAQISAITSPSNSNEAEPVQANVQKSNQINQSQIISQKQQEVVHDNISVVSSVLHSEKSSVENDLSKNKIPENYSTTVVNETVSKPISTTTVPEQTNVTFHNMEPAHSPVSTETTTHSAAPDSQVAENKEFDIPEPEFDIPEDTEEGSQDALGFDIF